MDTISDMLIRIKNAQAVGHQTVNVPYSKIKYNLAKILEKEKMIQKSELWGKKIRKAIKIELKYNQGKPAISGLKRMSKLGQRIYLKKNQIKPVKQGYGFLIVSTPQGLMTGEEAQKKGIGGEVICQVW